MSINIEDIRRRQLMQARAQLINETTVPEVELLFDLDDVVAAQNYQWQALDNGTHDALPQAFRDKYGDRATLFTHNKIFYDDDVEDVIAEDPIVQATIPHTRTSDPERNAAAMDTLRARRTTIALLLHVGASITRPLVESQSPERAAA